MTFSHLLSFKNSSFDVHCTLYRDVDVHNEAEWRVRCAAGLREGGSDHVWHRCRSCRTVSTALLTQAGRV